jgi:hypothetical protein
MPDETGAAKPAGSPTPAEVPAERPRDTGTARGFGRVLVAIYAVFALSATARAGYQIATKLDEAPLAYLLSALAALVYVVATVALARQTPRAYRVAVVAVTVELVGVLAVGLLSLLAPADFPHATVWSGFGRGYGFVPLVLPVVGLIWLWRHRPH